VPVFVAIVVGLVAGAFRDVVRDEVSKIPVDVLPGRKMRQPAARGAAVFELLAGLAGIDEDDGEVIDGDQSLFSNL
jgi:hypothetical protein